MTNAHDVILRPVLSEKGFQDAANEDGQRKYAFYVRLDSNRTQAKNAIQQVFGVEVVKINTLNVRGKLKRLGRYEGRRPQRKKVIVTLKAGQRIAQLDGLLENSN